MSFEEISQQIDLIRTEVARAVVGQDELIEHVLYAILARGHVLIEGVPGLGKTLLVRTLGRVLGCDHKRISFTPDLMPSDIAGGNVFDQREQRFTFIPGPIFTQLCLADEVNRAPAKTQAALLEAMQDRSVSSDGVTRELPSPFFVIATQNPVESQGTYPLPEAQLDRFMMKILVGHPTFEQEHAMLRGFVAGFDPSRLDALELRRLASPESILAMQAALQGVAVDDRVSQYIIEIVTRTRNHRSVFLGASPRASISLLACGRARAACDGRNFLTPDDVKSIAPSVLRHRLILQPDAEIEGISPDDCIAAILQDVPVPMMQG